ncbi:hypothetical protein CRUP_019904 [Coryphaenoides rupestris]|nr:hypothetical protein CRUP_019904 [Coryphaenoides rupestris]
MSQGSTFVSSALPSKSSLAPGERLVPGALALPRQPLFLRRRGGKGEHATAASPGRDSDGLLSPLVRSHSDPGLSSSNSTVDFIGSEGSKEGSQMSTDIGPSSEACLLGDTTSPPAGTLPSKASIKEAAVGSPLPAKPPTSPLRLPKDCHRSLGDLKVTRVLVARFLQRSRRNLAPSSDHTGNPGSQGPKRRAGAEGPPSTHLPLEQVIRSSFGTSRGHSNPNPNAHRHRGHSHSHSDSRHNRHGGGERAVAAEGIHLRSCGDLSSSSSSLRRLITPHAPHGSSGALYSESAL